jgi:N6-adenosine-specific RNA methylase IME4
MSGSVWPTGKYSVILADPPWRYQNWTDAKNGAAISHYSTMGVKDICDFPVGDLAADNCALLLWNTWPKLPEGLKTMEAWGFKFVSCAFVWNKTYADGRPYCGLGFYTRSGSEFVLLGKKGKITPKVRNIRQVITAPRTRHSVKPHLYKHIEALWDGPYIELFARHKQPGWEAWGDEI